MSRPGATCPRSSALALRLHFLIEALRLDLLPTSLGRAVAKLVSLPSDSGSIVRQAAEVGSAFGDSCVGLGLEDLQWPESHERSTVWAAKAALHAAERRGPAADAAERLGRFCEHLSTRGRDRRRSGSYYTPRWAAEFIAQTVIRDVLGGRRLEPQESLSLTVFDPAAGAGAFAVAAVEALAGAAGEALGENDLRREAARTCVFAVERNPLAAEACRLAVWLSSSRPARPAPMPAAHVRPGDALAEPREQGSFDVVIGNPPWGIRLPARRADVLARFAPRALRGHRDSYVFFLELSAELARDEGGVGMLLPDTVLWQTRYEGLRRVLLDRFRPSRVALLGDRVFAGATAPSCVLCLMGAPIAGPTFTISDLRREKRRSLPAHVGREGWSAAGEALLDAPHTSFLPPPDWLRDMLARLRSQLRSLGDSSSPFAVYDVGINYSRAAAGRSILYTGARRHGSDIPVTRGRDFGPFTDVGHSAWLRHDWPDRVQREDGVSVREAVYRQAPKIVLRQTGDRPVATVDREGVWFGRSVIAIASPDENDLHWLAAVLNSSVFAALYRAVAPEAGRPFAQVKVSKLKLLPLPPMAGTEHLGDLGARARDAPSGLKREALLREIDRRVAEAYGLDKKELARVALAVAATGRAAPARIELPSGTSSARRRRLRSSIRPN